MRAWWRLACVCALLALLVAGPWAVIGGVVLMITAPNGFPGLVLAAAGLGLSAWAVYRINKNFNEREAEHRRGETE